MDLPHTSSNDDPDMSLKQMDEIFRITKPFGGPKSKYRVTKDAVIYSFKRAKMRILKQRDSEDGYKVADLSFNKNSKPYRVHDVVAAAWIKNPDNLPIVNHKDGNKQNNNKKNLEWITFEACTRKRIDYSSY
jgi:hypothetical protein